MKRIFLGPVLKLLFRPWVKGLDNIPAGGAAIIASNHLSFSDSIFLPLVVPKILATDAFYIFLMVQFFRGIPRELDEAAMMDGCTRAQALWKVILISWGIAFFEYLLMVPANRWGNSVYSATELKIIQEVITLMVFVPFAVLYLKEPLKLDYVWAALCLVGAVYFIFRNS